MRTRQGGLIDSEAESANPDYGRRDGSDSSNRCFNQFRFHFVRGLLFSQAEMPLARKALDCIRFDGQFTAAGHAKSCLMAGSGFTCGHEGLYYSCVRRLFFSDSTLRVDIEPRPPSANQAILFEEAFCNGIILEVSAVGKTD